MKAEKLQTNSLKKTLRETRLSKSRYQTAASITVEATLVFTIFIFAILSFLNFFMITSTELKLHTVAAQTAKRIASYGYGLRYAERYIENCVDLTDCFPVSNNIEELAEAFIKKETGEAVIRQMVKDCMDKYEEDELWIKGGFDGISFDGSYICNEDKVIIKMSYCYKVIPLDVVDFPKTVQKVVVRCFSGHYVQKKDINEEESEEGFAYVTESGEVYHASTDCRSLKVTVETHNIYEVTALRNKNGERYSACKRCTDGDASNSAVTIYLTPYGESYHINVSCGSLKRVIQKIPLKEVGTRRACKLCGVILE